MPRIPQVSIKNSTELVVTQIPVNNKENVNALLGLWMSRINKDIDLRTTTDDMSSLFGKITGSKWIDRFIKEVFSHLLWVKQVITSLIDPKN